MSVVNKVLNISKQLFAIDEEIGELEEKKKMLENQIEETVVNTVTKKTKRTTKKKTKSYANISKNLTEKEKGQIINVLAKANKPLRPCEILDRMNVPKERRRAVDTRIWSMGKAGEIRKFKDKDTGFNVYVR